MSKFVAHEAANLFPLDAEHIDELAEDIKANGQQVAIELLDGKIIDGRRRFAACAQLGIEPRTKTVKVDDPIQYVLSLNLHRRHLTPSQLSMVAARVRGIYEKQAKERQVRKPGGSVPENLPEQKKGEARDLAGKAVGVSGKSVDYATRVLERGTPELVKAVDEGRVAVSTAAIHAGDSPEEQREFVNRVPSRNYVSCSKSPEEKRTAKPESQPPTNGEIDIVGVGIIRANEAINSLTRIPKNDALRQRGFQLVTDWIRHNK